MMLFRVFKWAGAFVFSLIVLAVAFVASFGWNWLRDPVSRLTTEKTGRELVIGGDLKIGVGWPLLRIRAADVKFGNPPWASQKYMLTADGIDFAMDLPALFSRHLKLDIVALRHGDVFLEANAAGQKNWLLDIEQKDEKTGLHIGRLALEQSRVAYDEPAQKTSLVAEVSTRDAAANGSADAGVVFQAKGQYRGMPLVAKGSGGPVLALRDETKPYPFMVEATIGRTSVRAEGSVTGLSRMTALDTKVTVRGDNVAQLFPVFGLAVPETGPYRTSGRITHDAGMWRYQDFSAHVGNSDCAGTLQLDTGGRRPFVHGELLFGQLEFADLGPVIGTRSGGKSPLPAPETETTAPDHHGVLPDIPFRTERWDTVDADIRLSAETIIRAKELPIEKLATHVTMRDSVLTLDPLDFGVAGDTLGGTIRLDGQRDPIKAHARLAAKEIVLHKLFPTLQLKSANVGHVTGSLDLTGTGNSVAGMLGTANGEVGLVVVGGEISKLAMEMAGLHVLEIITLKLGGDKPITIRCGMAGFQARDGVMRTEQLVFDTAVSNVGGSGSIDFGQQKFDLTLTPKSKEASLIALRSPIRVRGTFARPEVEVEKGPIIARSLGALALGVTNPFLALLPLVEAGPGMDSDCGRLIQEAKRQAPKAG